LDCADILQEERAGMAAPYTDDKDFQTANEAFEQGRFAEAMELLTPVAARYPTEPGVQHRLGLCALKRATKRMKDETVISTTDWRTAVEHLETARALEDTDEIATSLAVAHHNLGVCLNQEEDFEEAQEQYQRALAINPEMTEVSVNLAVNHADQGRLDTAEELLRAAVERSPDSLEARYTLGLVLRAQGKEAEAAEQFKEVEDLGRDNVNLHYNRGVLFANSGVFEEAEAAFRRALEIDPEFVPAHYNLGLLLRQQGKFAEAVGCFEEVTRLNPESPNGFFCLASCYERRNPAQAIPVWERYLELAAKHPNEAETVDKVTHHVAALKEKIKEA
ncbi:MAG: tetratricopeptide repeat protein, partial [Nitrospinota bacterium]